MKRIAATCLVAYFLAAACVFAERPDQTRQPRRPSLEYFSWGEDPVWKENWPAPPEKLPRKSRIHRLLSGKLPVEILDPPQKIRERETQNTKKWLSTFGHVPVTEAAQFQCAKVFDRDEAVLMEVRLHGDRMRVIDSRSLDIVYLKPGLGRRTIDENFKHLAAFINWNRPETELIELERVECGNGCEFKRLQIKQSWFGPIRPFEVLQRGNLFIISCDKVVTRNYSMVPDRPEQFVGGIPLEDERPWRRFESSNRQQLTDEYFEKWREEFRRPAVHSDLNAIKNAPPEFDTNNAPREPLPTSPPSSDTKSAPDAI